MWSFGKANGCEIVVLMIGAGSMSVDVSAVHLR